MYREKRTPRIPGSVENYRHLWMLVIWLVYIVLFFLVEHFVTENYTVVHIPLDDRIPFCEWFIFPYCFWHPLLALMTAYLAFWDAENFKRYMTFIALGFLPVIAFDWLFPNGQELRPLYFERENIATWLCSCIYAADTNTNVFPSMHVIGAAALYAAALHAPGLRKRRLDRVMLPLAVLISVSTVFVKQHSCLDTLCAIPYSALVWWLVYGVIFKKEKTA